MSSQIGGSRPRPRVAILGEFASSLLSKYDKLFPTIWYGKDIHELVCQVHPSEVDLLLIGKRIEEAGNWPVQTNVICFSSLIDSLPGPISYTHIFRKKTCETEEYIFPNIPMLLSQRRNVDFSNLTSVRGWSFLEYSYQAPPHISKRLTKDQIDKAKKSFQGSAIICDARTKTPFAVVFQRQINKLGVAWIPIEMVDQYSWVKAIVTLWSSTNVESFPDFGDWTNDPDWMVNEELEILKKIRSLEAEKEKTIIRFDQEIGKRYDTLSTTRVNTNKGRRRLITAQGDELLDEVKNVYIELGFNVEVVDQSIEPDAVKREDLRLTETEVDDSDWEAIVEVRGYKHSGGKSSDLARLGRFAELYHKEKGWFPSKRIYVINGQIELPPERRIEPLSSALEDVQIFADSDGLVMSTLDIFKIMKLHKKKELKKVKKTIVSSVGFWSPPT